MIFIASLMLISFLVGMGVGIALIGQEDEDDPIMFNEVGKCKYCGAAN